MSFLILAIDSRVECCLILKWPSLTPLKKFRKNILENHLKMINFTWSQCSVTYIDSRNHSRLQTNHANEIKTNIKTFPNIVNMFLPGQKLFQI